MREEWISNPPADRLNLTHRPLERAVSLQHHASSPGEFLETLEHQRLHETVGRLRLKPDLF